MKINPLLQVDTVAQAQEVPEEVVVYCGKNPEAHYITSTAAYKGLY